MTTTAKKRFQFTIADLLLLSLLVGLGVYLFEPVIRPIFGRPRPCSRTYPVGVLIMKFLIVLIPTALGGATGLIGARVKQSLPGSRTFGVLVGVGFFWMLLAAFLTTCPFLMHPRLAVNESAAIAACKTYASAQDIYRRTDVDSDGVLEYSTSIGGANGLYEEPPAGSSVDLLLLDRSFAQAEGLPCQVPHRAGYVFKVLTGQGPAANGGAKSYVVNGNMTAGYALVACPTDYDFSGRNTFIISNDGTVHQWDLGPDTPNIFANMSVYNPGPGWVIAE